MAAITTTGSGSWNSTTPNAPWPSGTIPVSGDTVTIDNGHTVTVPNGYTATIGSSPADDTGTPAIQCNGTTGTGILNVSGGGTLIYRGPIRQANATWTMAAGATITYDASLAATPSAALYTWQISQANSQANAKLICNGSSGFHVIFNSNGNVQSGGFDNPGGNVGAGKLQATYTDFSYHGPATSAGNFILMNLDAGDDFHLDNCTLNHCGQIQGTGPFTTGAGFGTTAIFRLKQTKITNPSNDTYTIQVYTCVGSLITGAGQRLIQNCDISGKKNINSTDGAGNSSQSGFTVINTIMRLRDLGTGVQQACVDLAGSMLNTWDQNFLCIISGSTSTVQDPQSILGVGIFTNTYVLRLVTPNGTWSSNMHPVYLDQRIGPCTLDGWVFQMTVTDEQGDVVNLTKDSTVANDPVRVQNCVYLENATGAIIGSLVNQQGGVTQTNTKIYFEHNTIGGQITGMPSSAVVWGVGTEASTWVVGCVPSIRSNLLWCRSSGNNTIANSATPSSTVPASSVNQASHNHSWNVTGSIYGNPSNQFNGSNYGTPGLQDTSGDPVFTDNNRSVLNFDQGYLGASVATTWVTSTAYNVGDLVSTTVVGFVNSQTFNWRCVTAHTSSAADKPGSGDFYTLNWEPACVKSISDDILAGNTYSGGANSLIGELVKWVKAGFNVSNRALYKTGHDGGTRGAGAYVGPLPPLNIDYSNFTKQKLADAYS